MGQNIKEFTLKTYQTEHLVDEQALKLKTLVYESKLPLAHKIELKEFISNIEKISDIAEDTADILNIMAVKHSL